MSGLIPAVATCCKPVKGSTYCWHPCGKPAKVRAADGKFYCGIHDPARRDARRAATEARWDAERRQRDRAYAAVEARRAVVEAAREAAHQRGSWDAVAEAVSRMEAAEEAARVEAAKG